MDPSSDVVRMSLDECAREPIHIPGAIQPHGVLLVIDAASGRVIQASANASSFLNVPPAAVAGADWRSLIDVDTDPATLLEGASTPLHPPFGPLRLVHAASRDRRTTYRGGWHLYEDRWLLEIERTADLDQQVDYREAHRLIRLLDNDRDVSRAASRVAAGIRSLYRYDRVMVYRFDRDWNGEVVAESVRHDLEPYLGLHYPSTDIPAQARALYLRNRVRSIGHIGYTPSPLEPLLDPLTGQPTDLSDVALRSVSPVHVEYLANMGVDATLVSSIIVDGRLWGLIACHHYSPKYPDCDAREIADDVTRALASRIGAIERFDMVEHESRLLALRERLISLFSRSAEITAEMLRDFSPELLEIADADGVALLDRHVVSRYGILPDDDALLAIRRRISEPQPTGVNNEVSGVLHTDHLGASFPEFVDIAATTAGVLFVPLDAASRSAILWSRVEQVRAVRWAGNPYLSKLQVIEGARLSPRQSFSAWQEVVRGRSHPWEPMHLESARALRLLVELMDRKHYQSGVGVLSATLDRLRQPLIVFAFDQAGVRPDVVHVSGTFAEATGLREPADILATWALGDPRTQTHLAMLKPFRLESKQPGTAGLELQPVVDVGQGRQHWIGLLQSD